MAFAFGLFLFAYLCTAYSSPLGETTVCESAPNVLSGLGLGLNLPPNLLLQLLSPNIPNVVSGVLPLNAGLPLLPNIGLPTGQATVCESTPNVPLNLPLPMPLPIPYSPYFPGGLLTNNLPGSTTVCESAANSVSPLNLPVGLPGLPYPWQIATLGLGMNGLGLPLNGLGGIGGLGGLGLPLNGLGLPLNGLGGLGVGALGLPVL